MSKLVLSKQQEMIVRAVESGESDVQVTARAGCGKTTTIIEACAVARGSVAFFAFNKSIAAELQARAPAGVKVQTLHALGFACLRSAYRGVQVDADKTYNLILPLLRDGEADLIGHAKKLVSLCKNNLVRPTPENLADLANEYDVQVNGESERVFEIVRAVMDASVPALGSANVAIDFDDMIFLPAFLPVSTPAYDWTFVDEAQDMNAAQQALVLKVARSGRLCYVGDPAQAIYRFRGADSDAMPNLAAKLRAKGRSVVELPLTETRRCPKKIVALAREYVGDFEALSDAPEGEVSTTRECSPAVNDMVICRLNRPLVPIAYRLLREGVPAKIQGKDIGAGLLAVIKKLAPHDVQSLLSKLGEYHARETARLSRQYGAKPSKLEAAIATLNDKVDALAEIASRHESVDAVVRSIESLFGDQASSKGVVLLSTIHKAKGLEADRVWLVETPSKGGPQENNVRYVAITRAKKSLVFVRE